MAKGRKTAALLGVLGAGLAASKLGNVSLGQLDPDRADVIDEAKRKYGFKGAQEYLSNPNRTPTDAERMQARKKVYETEPSLRGTLRTEDYVPILSGTGLPIRSGMKKGGVTRADGCITKGHTRGKMV
jgi:hypothetical protein